MGVSVADARDRAEPVAGAWGRRILWSVVILVVASLILTGPTLWDRITLTRVPNRIENYFSAGGRLHARQGWYSVKRWDTPGQRHGKAVFFYGEGRKALEEVWEDGALIRRTRWSFDGRVFRQTRHQQQANQPIDVRLSPPWWWGARDLPPRP